jgi:hypothetical protein
MARVKFNPNIEVHETTKKKTSIGGGRISTCMMNKSKKRSYKKYRGQGK